MNIKFRLSEKQEFDLVTSIQKYLARILKSKNENSWSYLICGISKSLVNFIKEIFCTI